VKYLPALALLILAGCTPLPKPKTFGYYICPQSGCATHQAGYDWAEKNVVPAKSWCNSKNVAFNEGCMTWVDESQRSVSPTPVDGQALDPTALNPSLQP
jgi:hypothetical protein